MSVGFGFSVGDFIAGIQLVRDVITSLQASGGSSLEYQALIIELFSLERALLEVKALRSPDHELNQLDALKCAASQCQNTIDHFMAKIQKYQPSLNAQGSGSKWRDGLRKIQWALCKKEDIATFKAEISGHAIAINLLVATAQFNATTTLTQKSENSGREHQDALNSVAKQTSWPATVLNSLKEGIKSCVRQGQELLATSRKIVQTNLQIFSAVLEIQKVITSIPAQVLRQQPVYFTDAYGLEVPFHLEFVYSPEILHDWLLRRFPKDREKIEYGEFALQDSKNQRYLDLTDQWITLFYPGMKVAMDIIYNVHIRSDLASSVCPGCRLHSQSSIEGGVCPGCGLYCHRPVVVQHYRPNSSKSEALLDLALAVMKTNLEVLEENEDLPTMSRKPDSFQVTHFRRVQIQVSQATVASTDPPSWLTTALKVLQLNYPDDNFHLQMVFDTVDSSGQMVTTVDQDSPWPPGTKGRYLPLVRCSDCEPSVFFFLKDQSELCVFESHLQESTHRQFVQNHKAILLAGSRSVMAIDKGSNFIGVKNPTAGSELGDINSINLENWDSLSNGGSGWPYKSSARGLERTGEVAWKVPSMMINYSGQNDSSRPDFLEGEGWGYFIYGKDHLEGRATTDAEGNAGATTTATVPTANNIWARNKKRRRKQKKRKTRC